MKYLFIIPALNAGGAERVMVTLANELVLQNNTVTILTLNTESCFYDLNEKVNINALNVVISKNKLNRIISLPIKEIIRIFKLKKFIKKYKPDLILSFLFTTNIMSIILHKLNKIPLIVSERNDPSSYNKYVKFLCKFLYPTADMVVCQGVEVSKFFLNSKKNNIKVIPNPIYEGSIATNIPSKRIKKIVAVGRLVPQKNFNLLIDSFYDIANKFPEHTLEIYGTGYLKDDLEKRIELLGLKNRVKLMGLQKNIMLNVYDYELFIMSSNFEGFPNALIEAMASGLPVISTDFASGIAREYITNYENGLLIPTNDRESLAEAIEIILSDKNLQNKMSKNNKKIINNLNVKQIMKEWNDAFEQFKRN